MNLKLPERLPELPRVILLGHLASLNLLGDKALQKTKAGVITSAYF